MEACLVGSVEEYAGLVTVHAVVCKGSGSHIPNQTPEADCFRSKIVQESALQLYR